MKLTKVVSIFGWSCIITGLALFFIPEKEIKEEQKQAIEPFTKEKICLREMLFYEARNTSVKEREAILDVTLNRYRNKRYPSTICEVVQQDKQYSYRNSLKDKSEIILPAFQDIVSILDKKAYLEIEKIVDKRFEGAKILPNKVLPENALWYHTKSMKKYPKWSRSKKKVKIPLDKSFKHVYYSSINQLN